MNRIRCSVSVLCLLALVLTGRALTLEWDPSPDSWVAGYNIYAHTNQSVRRHHLTNAAIRVDCATNTTCTLSNLPSGRWAFVATAYTADGQESLPSNEVAVRLQGSNWAGILIASETTNLTVKGAVRTR